MNWFDPWVCAITIDDLDRIVVTSGTDGGVTRVNVTGGVDTTFATNGIFTPPPSAVQRLFLGITTSASGAIYAGGVDYAETAPG